MRDFTVRQYRDLCYAILERHTPVSVWRYLRENPENAAIIRHDVDKKPENALVMAGVEHDLGISSTYYFRTVPESFNLQIMEKIHGLGHEIGYHYEVLDKAKGDAGTAIGIFERELSLFPTPVRTICMHGNPITPWDNRDLWKTYDYRKFGIEGEAYLSLDFVKIQYFSDTGRTWHNRYSVKDITKNKTATVPPVSDTSDLIRHIRECTEPVCIVTHPQRWNDAFWPWIAELVGQSVKNVGKGLINFSRRSP